MLFVTTVLPVEVLAADSYTSSEWKAWASKGYIYKYKGAASGYDGYYVSYNTDEDTTPEEIGWSSMMYIKETDTNGNELKNAAEELVYCCDLLTHTADNARYKKTVIENAAYFDPDDPVRNQQIAKRIRNAVLHGYPFVSEKTLTNEVRAWLAEDSSRGSLSTSGDLDKKALITGTQMAIWNLANSETSPVSYYSDDGNNNGGTSYYDVDATYKNGRYTYKYRKNHSSDNEKNANAVRDYLLAMAEEGQAAAPDTVAVGDVDVTASIIEKPASEGGGFVLSGDFRFYSYDPEDPNGPANNTNDGEIISERLVAKPATPDNQDIKMDITIQNPGGGKTTLYSGNLNQLVDQGTLISLDEETLTYTYNIPLDIDRATAIAYGATAEVSIGFEGNQQMPRNVYFYQTPLDNSSSQNLIGVSEWVNKIDVSATASAEVELSGVIIGEDTGFTDIPFSNGYTGYCIDRDKHGIDVVGEVKFIELDTSEAKSNVGNKEDISDELKILFTQGFDKIFVPDGNGSYVVDENIKDSTLPAVIYHYTENQHVWGEQKTLTDIVANYDGPEIPDDGYSIVLENGDTVTFHFMVLSPISGNNASNTQEFFAFKIDVEQAPVITTQNISVQKVWDDADNQDGIRPNSVTVQLLADGSAQGAEVTLNESNNWTYTWTELPESANGSNIAYTVEEVNVPEGYTSAVAGSEENGFTIVNNHTPEKTSVSVVKAWDDADNQDGIRPESVKVQLKANGQAAGEVITLSAVNNWTYTWTDLAKNASGLLIAYTVEEVDIPTGYTAQVAGNADDGFTITNTHAPEKTTVSVVKEWDDADNQDGIRPVSVQVQLYADGNAVDQVVTLDAENNWSYTWEDLAKNAEGKTIEYTVDETSVPDGYTKEVENTGNDFVITNSHTPYETSVSVLKVWEDANNQDGIRPAEIKVQLYADGNAQGEAVTLNVDNKWSYTWEDLTANKAGQAIVYTVDETEIPDGYTKSIEGDAATGYTIINTHAPDKTAVSVVKVWEDNNNQDGIRPDSIQVQLYADGKAQGDAVTLNAKNNWTYIWTDLDKKAEGKTIEYTVDEAAVPVGYTKSIEGNAKDGFVITNTHEVELTSIDVTKVWNDKNDQDGIRPEKIAVQLYADGEAEGGAITLSAENNWEYTWTDLDKNNAGKTVTYTVGEVVVPEGYTSEITGDAAKGYTITNSYTPEVTSVDVTKVWNDKNDRDGIRPDSVKVQLLANGEAKGDVVTLNAANEWAYTWTKLAKNSGGDTIVYTVVESEVPEGYTAEIKGSVSEGFVITNSYTPEQISVSVAKEWKDASNQDGLRPASVKVQLYANGEAKGDAVVLSAENGWAYTWKALAKNAGGQPIEYTVNESEVPEGYTAAITGNTADGFVITNSHTPAVTEVKVTKEWNDNNDQDGIRPDSINVQLKADGTNYGDPITLSKDNNWTYTWTDLAKLSEGIAINYRVVEQTVPNGYTSEIAGSMADGFVITNSHTPAVTEMSVAKVWDDNNDQDGLRPDSIQVQLKADDEAKGEPVTLSEDNGWTYTWEDLDQKADGKTIKYTVDETAIPEGYIKEVSREGNNVVIINSHTPAVTEVKVTKAWNDKNDQDGIRPDSIKVQLLADGEAASDPVTLSKDNNWTYTWTDLAKKADGKSIAYTLEEVTAAEGYTSKITGSAEAGYTITNIHTPETIDIEIEKLWEDLNDIEGIRSEEVTITLKADGEEISEIPVSDINEWNDEWNDLPKYKDGEEIEYTITVDGVPEDYVTEDTVVSKTEDGKIKFTVLSKYEPKTSVAVEKVWDDAKDQDGLRPEGVQVQLYADGEAYGDPVRLTEEGGWAYTWEGLIKYVNGSEQAELVEYTVKEVAVPDGYTSETTGSATDGFIITNSHTPDVTEVSVTKVWNDADDQDGLRPDSIEVKLFANGEEAGKVAIDESTDWTYTWEGLAKFADGEEIIYTVTESAELKGYRSAVTGDAANGFTITNTHAPEITEVTVEKVWDDADDQDGLRPAAIEVQLTAGKDDHSTVVLSEDNDWTYTWTELAKFNAGEEITYAVKEIGDIEGYETKITGSAAAGFVITNSHTPAARDIVVEKVWEDADDQDGLRPDSIKVQLYANDEPFEDAVELSAANEWSCVWEGLDKYAAGEEIIYTVEESDVPEKYISETTGSVDEGFVITNTYEPAATDVTVTKVWEDADNQDGLRPDSIEIQLFADDKEYGRAVTLSEANDWTYTWENLDKYAAGEEITYAVAEADIPEGYKCYITRDAANDFVITNSHTPATTEVSVTKKWQDAKDQDGLRPDFVQVQLLADGEAAGTVVILDESNGWTCEWKDLPQYAAGEEIEYTVDELSKIEGYETAITGDAATGYTITNKHTPAVTTVKAVKVWDDADDQDGIRPDSIEVQLLADGVAKGKAITLNEDNEWTYEWAELPEYAAGEAIEYAIAEVDAPEGYISTVTGDASVGFTITNTHVPAVTDMTVTKVWEDADNQDGIRPDSIEVKLLADGKDTGKTVILSEENGWAFTWTELAKFEAGDAIEYSVEENSQIKGYEAKITGNAAEGFIITNSHVTEVTTVDVTKVWEDVDNQDGIRPESIEVKLLADGDATGKTAVLNEENGWKFTWEELDKYAAGEEVTYTIAEVAVPEGYTSKITGNAADGFTVTNTHTPATTEVAVTKVWEDADNQDGIRPEYIKVQLYANDEAYGEPIEISETDSWKFTWEELDKYADGEFINYAVAEVKIPEGYTSTISGSATEGYTITNTHSPEMIKMFVFKRWIDNSDQEGIRPENVEIQLYGDEDKVGKPLDLSDGNEWNDKWSELPKNEDGEEIDYSIEVSGVPEEYSTDINDTTKDDEEGFIVVSEYEPTVEVSVQKVWEDENDKDKIRKRSVKIQLYADGKAVGDPVKISASNEWKHTWADLEKYDDTEKRIEYTVDEVEIPEGYTKTITGNAEEGFTITNTHVVKAVMIDDSADTGDHSCMILWAMMLLTSLTIMVLILAMSRRRNSQQA